MRSINDCVDDGKYSLQDFGIDATDVEIKSHECSLGFVSRIHFDILHKERKIKKQ